MALRCKRRLIKYCVLLYLLSSTLLQVLPAEADHSLQNGIVVHFIDVGQGDAILIDTHQLDVLVDGGPRAAGRKVIGYLLAEGVSSIYLISTHPDADHIGGLVVVMREGPKMGLTVPVVYYNGQEKGTKTFQAFKALMQDRRAILARRGLTLQLDEGVLLSFLHPPQPLTFRDFNENSVVLLLALGRNRVLLTGDCERGCEASLLASGLDLKAQVLKVGHHGSRSSTTRAFLEAVKPEMAIISVGADNRYGHPHPEVTSRLESLGIPYFRTDLHGTVKLLLNATHYKFIPQRDIPPIPELSSPALALFLAFLSVLPLLYLMKPQKRSDHPQEAYNHLQQQFRGKKDDRA